MQDVENRFYKAEWNSKKMGWDLVPKLINTPKKVTKKVEEEYKDKPPYKVIIQYETIFQEAYMKGLPKLFEAIENKIVSFAN